MDKKFILVLIFVFILAVGTYMYLTSNDGTKFGSSSLKVPKGYNVTKKVNNSIELSNNKTTFNVLDYKNKSINSIVKQYKDKHGSENVSETSKKVGKTEVKRLTLKKNNESVHTNYYYSKNGHTYRITVKGAADTKAFDYIVNTTKKNILPF